jgi:hypothetical protein
VPEQGQGVSSERVIFFDHPQGGRFNFRVAGVAYANDRVLLQRVAGIDFWLPAVNASPATLFQG